MKSNYNDIIDIILTLVEDEEVAKNIAVSGSIVPYIIEGKESGEYHTDFYILVKSKKIGLVRDKLKNLTKEYDFDIVSDSKKYGAGDYGFKVKYQDTALGFFPYSLIDNNLTIRTFSINKEDGKVKLKTKTVPNVSKSSIIRLISFAEDKKLRIMSPEFILSDKEMREQQPGNPTKETMFLLNKISDEEILSSVRNSVKNTKVKIITKGVVNTNFILTITLAVLFVVLLVIAYICFKK